MAKTRAQIQSEINQKNKEEQSYLTSKSNYEQALNYASQLVSTLNSINKDINSSKDYLKKYYTINGKTADNGKLDDMKNNITQYLKNLNNNIIPEIKKNISALNTKISGIEREVLLLEKQYIKAQM